jgi:hypothetical protein
MLTISIDLGCAPVLHCPTHYHKISGLLLGLASVGESYALSHVL